MGGRSTTPEFIHKAFIKHSGYYTYDQVVYTTQTVKVVITCPVHGEFRQTPRDHLHGHGCKECANTRIMDSKVRGRSYFIQKSIDRHGNTYTYHKVPIGVKSTDIVTISCKVHGDFLQQISSHIQGHGCKACGTNKVASSLRYSAESFENRAQLVHDHRYTYVQDYTGSSSAITVECEYHGKFLQTASTHLAGHGCPKCALESNSISYRLSKGGPALVYYVKLSRDGITGYKIGVTSKTVKERFSSYDLMGTTYTTLKEWPFEHAGDAYKYELEILKEFRPYTNKLTLLRSGNTEIFTIDVLNLD